MISRRDFQEAKEEAGYVLVQRSAADLPEILELDLTYNSTLGPLHEDFDKRSTVLEAKAGSPLIVRLPAPEDLALTKLGRLSPVDIEDIITLMNVPGASWEKLESLTAETERSYVGPPDLIGSCTTL